MPASSQISGKQYGNFSKTVHEVLKQVQALEPSISNMLDLALFLYYVDMQDRLKVTDEEIEEADHQTMVEDLLKLGMSLGFDVDSLVKIAKGAVIDVVWRARVANLGSISYAFEAHVRGSRDSAIINLQRSLADPSIQKTVIVSTEKELQRFRGEISSLPESLREAVCYFDVKDLKQAVAYQEAFLEIPDRVGLQKKSMPSP